MRGDGADAGEVARDLEGEVDRALRRSEARGEGREATDGERSGQVVSPGEIRAVLKQAIREGRGIVALEVRRPGEQAVRARLSPMVWAAVWDALTLDPDVQRAHKQGDAGDAGEQQAHGAE